MTAPALRSSSKFADVANATSRNCPVPAGRVAGDIFYLFVSIDVTATITQPTGFTTLFDQVEPNSNMRLALFERTADGTEGANFTVATSSEIAAGICHCISGANATDTMSVWGGETNATRSSAVVPTLEAYAACTDGSLVIQCAAFDNGAGSNTFTAKPTGYTDVDSAGASSSGTHMRSVYKTMASQGYVGPDSWTYAVNTEQGWSITLVVRATANSTYPAQPVIRSMNALHQPSGVAATLLKPYGTVNNDLLLLVQTAPDASTLTPPAAFTSILDTNNGTDTYHQAYYRIASSEGASYSVANSSADGPLCVLMRIVNAATSSPIDTNTSSATGTSNTPTATTITPSVNNCLLFYTEGSDDDEVTTNSGYPSGWSGVYAESNDDGTPDQGMIIARLEQTTAGATGSVAGSFTASEQWVAFLFAIKPASNAVNGTLSKTLDAATLSATGKVALKGVVSATLGSLTSAGAGALKIVGTVSKTLGALTLSAAAKLIAKGTVSNTLADVTLSAASKLVIHSVTSNTLANVTLSATGKLAIHGTVSVTLGALLASGTAGLKITGNVAATLGALTLDAEATIGTPATTGSPGGVYKIFLRRRRRSR